MAGMITLLIGHRGVGKTTCLKFLPASCRGLDLDAEIEKETGLPLEALFARGETVFRDAEVKTLQRLMSTASAPTWIAVGAGYSGPRPKGVRVVWLRRDTDKLGRSFLNRPRLNTQVAPLEEYLQRFAERNERYYEWADEELFLPEGYRGGLEAFLLNEPLTVPADLTLLPENFRDLAGFVQRRRVRRFELREDLLSPEQLEMALKLIPKKNVLFSRRRSEGVNPPNLDIDWALELGAPAEGESYFSYSLHEREQDFQSSLVKLSAFAKTGAVLKLAVEVKDFSELLLGHRWWMGDPKRRSFMPRSRNGHWQWYRTLFGPQMPIHFFREGSGSSLDQPLLWQMLMQPAFAGTFAAVLGDPVEHSRSPLEHLHFFKQDPFVAIMIPELEFPVAFKMLTELGLRFAAVTAPLKGIAWAMSHEVTPETRGLKAANTLFIEAGRVYAHNTDVLALRQWKTELPDVESIWLWGGGGVKSSVLATFPQAVEISARRGPGDQPNPEMVIWAVGRSRKVALPEARVRPNLIVDLNYGDDSPGLEWAVRDGISYRSGLRMFELQAELQREFWANKAKVGHL